MNIYKGETLGVVGESGCGKSTLGRVVMGIYHPTKGKISYSGKEVDLKKTKDRFEYSKKAQIVFQDPYASLNPRMTVGDIIAEGMEIHNMYDKAKRQQRVYELLETVGLNKEHANRFPHEFSGGQRQRIGIARALAIEPEFLVCDEPISALDVSIQSQVINLLKELQERLGLTYMFIAHDLNIVKYISDRIAVMYLGNLVEMADSDELYTHTLHPYSQALLASVPSPTPTARPRRRRACCRAMCPAPSTPSPAANLPAAARTPPTAAAPRPRRCARCARTTLWRAIWWKRKADGPGPAFPRGNIQSKTGRRPRLQKARAAAFLRAVLTRILQKGETRRFQRGVKPCGNCGKLAAKRGKHTQKRKKATKMRGDN